MLEEILMYLKQYPDGVSSAELAKIFLKIQNTQSNFAHLTISSILSKNKKCYLDDQGKWHVHLTSSVATPINKLPLTAAFILGNPDKKDRRIYYVSLWKILPEPEYIWGGWTVDLETLRKIDLYQLVSIHDSHLDCPRNNDLALRAKHQLSSAIPVFLSSYEHNLLKSSVYHSGVELTDDSIHLCELLEAASIDNSDSGNLYSCFSTIFGKTPDLSSAFKQGQSFAECIHETIRILQEKGIDSREDIDGALKKSRCSVIQGKAFSYEDICSLPPNRGVFGFKDRDGKYLYIGKTDNLKRKILGFLRNPDENPVKLNSMLQMSYSLITYQCGSELEAILYEYRLIIKHSPELNLKIEDAQSEEPQFTPNDCIILLPHTQSDSIMTFWFRKNSKIKIKPLSFRSNEPYIRDLEDFFTQGNDKNEDPDTIEMRLACRWIDKNQNQIINIPINKPVSGSEILRTIKFFWNNRLTGEENRNTL